MIDRSLSVDSSVERDRRSVRSRPTVTLAAGVLERAGLIENTRGSVKILNRKRLEDVACECYAAIQSYRSGLALQY